MAFSDLCHISNAYKAVENEPDQSERIMEENSMVRDLITKILDETGPADGNSSIQPSEKTINGLTNQHPKDAGPYNMPPNIGYPNMYNFTQNDQNSFNNFNVQNGFGNNGFVNYNNNDVTTLLGVDMVDTSADVTPEQLNLLRLAAQEIGGAQFTNANINKYDDKFYNFYEQNQRNSLQENNMFPNNFNRPNSLNLDMNFNGNFNENLYNNMQRYPNKFDNSFVKDTNQDTSEILNYLNNLNISLERQNDAIPNNMEFKMPMEMNGHYQNEEFKMQEERNKILFNRNFPPPKGYNGENYFINDMINQMNDRNPANPNQINQNFDFTQPPNTMNFKPNGFHQNEYIRRDINQPMMRENFPPNGSIEQRNFENTVNRDAAGMQQAAIMRQNQELARQMSLLMRNRPPPNQLNVDVSFLHENAPFNMGLGALLGPSPPAPPVLPSPMLDLPLLAPFYAMRSCRGAVTSSGILHARLDACYEQWRQLERERKRTEARLALAYPGRAVSSSNSIPVPRLPPCPTRVDRLTVDMLREHTKVLTLMGKMETLRASVCVAQNKRPSKPEESKITLLKRGQENVACEKEKENGVDPATFDPNSWKEDVKNLAEIAPHSEVESAMLAWRGAVAAVQAARRRELAPHAAAGTRRQADPILQLAEAVKQLCVMARRARCAMWCDLTLTVALAHQQPANTTQNETQSTQSIPKSNSATPSNSSNNSTSSLNSSSKASSSDTKEPQDKSNDTTTNTSTATKNDTKTENNNSTSSNNNKTTVNNKQQDKTTEKNRRTQNYRKLNQGRNDFYQKNQRYDNRCMHRHPYYLATGPIN